MRTVEIEVYSFDELSSKAKRIAIDWYLHWFNVDLDHTMEYIKDVAYTIGLTLENFEWSGLSHSVKGHYSYKEVPKETYHTLENPVRDLVDQLMNISETTGVTLGCTLEPNRSGTRIESEGDTPASVEGILNEFCKWILRTLQEEHEYLCSDEHISEALRTMDYEFFQDGRVYYAAPN